MRLNTPWNPMRGEWSRPPGAIAGTANEQVFIPEASDAAAIPLPLIPMAPETKATPHKSTGTTTLDASPAAPKKKAKRGAAKKAAGRNPARKSSKRAKTAKPTGRKAVGSKKSAKKAAKKTTKQAVKKAVKNKKAAKKKTKRG
jgi:hypothetical protein